MDTTISTDGTAIAFDRWGTGPLVVIVGGAFNDRNTWAPLAQELASSFTVISYDRRGRGGSGDTRPYAVEREIEDLAAVIRTTGADGRAFVHSVSSGAALALRAAAGGAPISRLSVFEPPYRIEGGPPIPPGYVDRLRELTDAGRNDEIVEYFQLEAVGLPREMVDQMKSSPAWAYLTALAPTVIYDAYCLGGNDQRVPVDLLRQVAVPTLALSSSGSAEFLRDATAATAEAIPGASMVTLEGGFHQVLPEVLGPVLTDFFTKRAPEAQAAGMRTSAG